MGGLQCGECQGEKTEGRKGYTICMYGDTSAVLDGGPRRAGGLDTHGVCGSRLRTTGEKQAAARHRPVCPVKKTQATSPARARPAPKSCHVGCWHSEPGQPSVSPPGDHLGSGGGLPWAANSKPAGFLGTLPGAYSLTHSGEPPHLSGSQCP